MYVCGCEHRFFTVRGEKYYIELYLVPILRMDTRKSTQVCYYLSECVLTHVVRYKVAVTHPSCVR